jgi:hypothetical protein
MLTDLDELRRANPEAAKGIIIINVQCGDVDLPWTIDSLELSIRYDLRRRGKLVSLSSREPWRPATPVTPVSAASPGFALVECPGVEA